MRRSAVRSRSAPPRRVNGLAAGLCRNSNGLKIRADPQRTSWADVSWRQPLRNRSSAFHGQAGFPLIGRKGWGSLRHVATAAGLSGLPQRRQGFQHGSQLGRADAAELLGQVGGSGASGAGQGSA